MCNNKTPAPGEIFTNEKGQKYQIITVAKHSITKEKLVIYQALYGAFDIRALPLDRFGIKKKKTEDKSVDIPETSYPESNENLTDNKSDRDKRTVEQDIKIENYTRECPEGMNLLLYAFLEADTVHDRLKLVRDMDNRKYIDDKCIDDMAASIDVTIDEGLIEERIRQLISCLDTMKRFEVLRR